MANKKKWSRIKRFNYELRMQLKYHKTPILIFIGLLLFPIIIGLIYKIPVAFVDIEIGDLLSFYGVALGIFSSFLFYREDENNKALAKQESLRPTIELSVELDGTVIPTFCITNPTDNDYIIDYLECGCHEDEERRPLNANDQLKITLDNWDEIYPKTILIGIKDDDNHEWMIEFEYQDGANKYCRVSIDLLA